MAIIILAVGPAAIQPQQASPIRILQSQSYRASFVVVIMMENRNYADIIGNLVSAPYLNRLAGAYSVAASYFDVSQNRSLPNYMGLIAGNTFNHWSGCNVGPYSCKGWTPVTDPTLIDRVENAGLTWKAYMEAMPSDCYLYDSGLYAVRHDPFVYLASVLNNPAECSRVVPAGTAASNLISDLNSASTASNFMWLTPNLCNDMHDCSSSVGDTYLSAVVPQILNSSIFRRQNAAIFLTWDEGSGSNSTHVPALWIGPAVRNNFTSNSRHNHYSLLTTLETIWHFSPLTANDAQANPMTEFLHPPTISINYTPTTVVAPQPVSFTATAQGGTPPYNYSWTFGDGGRATGGAPIHEFAKPGSYDVSITVTDSFNNTSSDSVNLRVSNPVPIPRPAIAARPTLASWLLGTDAILVIIGSALITVATGAFVTRRKAAAPNSAT